ncbi:MAG: hypothetical protein IANPNBLG_04950 [Bryobacteraceae bacterium]|nr:hypothetical protein [Bryobacteraceae bacterium]
MLLLSMNWNDAAEDLLQGILSRTPRPVREETENSLRRIAEAAAEEEGLQRVGVNMVVAAWVKNTPEAVREDLPRQMEQMGLDPEDFDYLLDG